MTTFENPKIAQVPKQFRDYPYVWLWEFHLGAYATYRESRVLAARQENAPYGATYRDDATGGWHTTDDITSKRTRLRLGLTLIVAVPSRVEIKKNDGTAVGWDWDQLTEDQHAELLRVLPGPHYRVDV